jgi:hypothetical protein
MLQENGAFPQSLGDPIEGKLHNVTELEAWKNPTEGSGLISRRFSIPNRPSHAN